MRFCCVARTLPLTRSSGASRRDVDECGGDSETFTAVLKGAREAAAATAGSGAGASVRPALANASTRLTRTLKASRAVKHKQ